MSIEIRTQPIPEYIAEACAQLSAADRAMSTEEGRDGQRCREAHASPLAGRGDRTVGVLATVRSPDNPKPPAAPSPVLPTSPILTGDDHILSVAGGSRSLGLFRAWADKVIESWENEWVR